MREEEEGGGRVSLEVVVDPRRRDAVRVKKLALGEVALAFGAGALGKVECGKSECGWHGGDAFGRASTVGAAGASNVEATAWRARCGAVCGGVSRDDSDAVPMVFFEAGLGSAVRSMESRRALGLASGGAEIRAEIGTVTGSMASARRMVGFQA